MRITSKGQVTIPQEIREKYGLLPETEVDFVEQDGSVVIVPAPRRRPDRGDRAVARLRATGRRKLTTDELLALTRG
jgi:AbrB family looped-hinge helix DNA binding protein